MIAVYGMGCGSLQGDLVLDVHVPKDARLSVRRVCKVACRERGRTMLGKADGRTKGYARKLIR